MSANEKQRDGRIETAKDFSHIRSQKRNNNSVQKSIRKTKRNSTETSFNTTLDRFLSSRTNRELTGTINAVPQTSPKQKTVSCTEMPVIKPTNAVKLDGKEIKQEGEEEDAEDSPECPYCGQLFANDESMDKHLVCHAHEGRYMCPVCNYDTIYVVEIRLHLLRNHKELF